MKKQILRILTFIICMTIITSITHAQPPRPPSGHGHDNNQPSQNGGGAPIGSGLAILLLLGTAYGGVKLWNQRNKID